jgi:hypothetical protein
MPTHRIFVHFPLALLPVAFLADLFVHPGKPSALTGLDLPPARFDRNAVVRDCRRQ